MGPFTDPVNSATEHVPAILTKQDFIRIIPNVVTWKDLEECLSLLSMHVSTFNRTGLSCPYTATSLL